MRNFAKKTLMFGGATLCAICSTASYAQSRVTLYGLIDEAVMYTSNVTGGKKVFLDTLGGATPSRWGLQGVEDLGGGLSTIFTMESGINLNNGAFSLGNTPFGRQIFVGLSHPNYGSLTFGRQYDMIFYFAQPVTGVYLIGSAPSMHPGDLDNTGNTIRTNNAIRYMSPEFHGLSFGGLYSVGGIPGNTTANSGYSLGAQYVFGGLKVAGAFQYFKNPTSSTAGQGFFTNNVSGATTLANSLNKAYSTATAYQVGVIGASYTIGPVIVGGSFSNTQYANLGSGFHNGMVRFNIFDAGVRYSYSPFVTFGLGYNYTISNGVTAADGKLVGNQHYNQVFGLADYLLSKRTDIYFTWAWQAASGTSSVGTPAVADIGNLGDSSTNHQFMVRLSLRHRF
jgi:predicted porin